MKKIINKFKSFYNNTYGKLITISWVLLALCLIIKLFGGNWFELNTENSKFIEFCLYVENKTILKRLIALIICLLTTIPVYCIMLNQKKPKLKIMLLLIALTIIKSIISWYNTTISFILDFVITLGVMTIFNKNIKRNIVCVIIVNVLQIMTILIRNVSFGFGGYNFGNSVIENMLYQIDYYIMIVLFYLYNFKRKEIK